MALFELVIALLLGAAVLTTISQKVGVPFPVLLALGGAALAYRGTTGYCPAKAALAAQR